MSQKIKTSVEIDGSLSASQIANATTDTDKFLVSDGGTVKYRTGAELVSDLGITVGTANHVQHQVKAGVAINKGQAVYVTGANGTNMIVGLASNASEATSSKTMGLLNATVATNGFADVITEGLLDGLNTSAATAGDPIWLGTGGNLIYGLTNKPYAPNHLVFIGIVTRAHANQGEIFVKVQNGFELDELHDVDLKTTTPVNGHILGHNGTLWVNKTIAGWLGYTPYNASNPAGYISSYTETDTLSSVTGRGASTSNQITLSGGGDNYNTYSSLRFAGYNQGGGTGYHGFFELENTYSSGTNKKKFFRLDSSGTIQIINSAYTSNIFNLTDAGDLTVNKIIKSGGTSSQYLMADGSVSSGGGGGVTSFNTRTGAVTLTSGDVTGALGYTPYNSSNPNGYISSYTETSTLANVTARGATTTTSLTANSFIKTGGNGAQFLMADGTTSTNPGWLISINSLMVTNALGYTPYNSSNPNGYISSYTETDTLASVTARGATTGTSITVGGVFTTKGTNPYIQWQNSAGTRLGYIQHATNLVMSSDTGNIEFTPNSGLVKMLGHIRYGGASAYSSTGLDSNGFYQDVNGTNIYESTMRLQSNILSGVSSYNGLKFGAAAIGNASEGFTIFTGGYDNNRLTINSSGNATFGVDARAPIFYDSNDTSYYTNPASTSVLSSITLRGAAAISFYGAGSGTYNIGAIYSGTSINSWEAPLETDSYTAARVPFILTWRGGYAAKGGLKLTGDASGELGGNVILHAGNYSSYAVPTSRTITINGTTQDLSANRSFTVSGTVTSGVSITSAGSASNTPSTPSVNIGMYVDTYAFIDLSTANTNGGWIDFSKADGGDYGGRIRYVNGSDYFSISAGATEQVRIFNSNAEAIGSFRAPIFYDSNNTGYYLDPASTSNLNAVNFSTLYSNRSGASGNVITIDNAGTGTWPFIFQTSEVGNDNASGFWVGAGGLPDMRLRKDDGTVRALISSWERSYTTYGLTDATDMRAPIFYDTDNTGYYLNPASSSYLNVLTCANVVNGAFLGVSNTSNSSGNGISLYNGGGSGQPTYGLMFAGTGTFGTHGSITSDWSTYFTMNDDSGRGWIFKRGTTNVASISGGGILQTSGYMYSSTYMQSGQSMYSPIYYDANDSSYYIDPATTSTSVNVRGYIKNPSVWINNGNDVNGYNENIRLYNASNGVSVIAFGASGTSGTPQSAILGFSDRYEVRVGSGNQWQQRSYNGYTEIYGSVRSPMFYDSNDTGYYWDPATDASHRFQTPSGYIDIGPKNGGTCHIYTDRPSFYFNKDILVNGSTVLNTSNAPRAANSYVMFYEGFTLNANDMSTNSTGFTYSNNAPWTGPVARFSTGGGYDLWLNASYGGNGTGLSYRTRNGDAGTYNSWHRIYSDSYRPYADDSGTTGQRSFNYLYASSYLESGGAVYGTIFYDNNNRGYYMDPDGTSQLSSIYTNNWVRVQGDSGVYSQDYGGHLRRPVNASHGTWEIFGYNKNGYAGMNVYDPQGYNNNYMHESGNGGLYQQNGNGWVFYHHRGNACFGVMTSTTSSSYKLYVGGSIYAEGDIVAYSDRRKKENIVTVDNALDTVNKLRGVYYNRIDDDSKKRQIGVIAQEIQEVLPEVVTHAKDVDEYGVSYGNITGLLIEAIKEQQTQIEELKELLNNLINK